MPFEINVLNKKKRLIDSLTKRIRHFYDLYFLCNDLEYSI